MHCDEVKPPVLGEVTEALGERVVTDADLAQERAVDDEVGIAADRRPAITSLLRTSSPLSIACCEKFNARAR
jgi:hypothetical protein